MASSVQVLAPNGRRQTVKCNANTTILQIIEEVCRKQGFKAEDYDIKHHNKVLDTTTAFRFSGLPNNAQLELAAAIKTRVDSEVTLAVGLEDGSRLMGTFLPDATLWDVLNKLCPNEIAQNTNLVVVYMRNELYGEKLQETTLKSLGIRGGRAMIRLVNKSPDELKTQANISAPLPVKPTEEKPFKRTFIPVEQPVIEVQNDSDSIQKKQEVDLLKLAKEREKRKMQSPPKTPEMPSPRVKPKIEQVEDVEMAVDVSEPSQSLNKYENLEENFVFLGERQAMLFSLECAQSMPAEDLPDDFFELTIDDAKKILGDIRRNRSTMENANLMTTAMRNLEESKKQLRHLHKYKQSVIRVQFGDKTILQGSFKPIETVSDIKDFVKGYLSNPTSGFYLYTTPPKEILADEKNLLEVGCVPGALLHIGSDAGDISLKNELKNKFTTNSMASLAASKLRSQSTRITSSDEPESSLESMEVTSSDPDVAGPSSQPTSYERKVFKSTEKVPKWFKPSK